jgi:murein L,D-transpeptidase YcbB/YkuD
MTMETRRSVRPRRWLSLAAVIVSGALVASACGSSDKSGSTTDPVAAAQARVASAQTNVTNAEKALTEANQQFCAAGKDYVSALDRYGKAFDDSKATVGDVKTAGADVAEPRGNVESAINSVGTARDDLAGAQKELADANIALANATAAAGTPTSPSTAPAATTTTTLVPTTTIARVKQAEADFTKAISGVSDSTPVGQAGIAVNSAAFALEATWLQLLAQAGCLSDAQRSQAIASVQEYTVALQTELQTAGYYNGKIDGVYGPETVDAVKKLQTDNALPVTGLVDRATAAALDKKVHGLANALQAVLKVTGYWSGPVDGNWTPELTTALEQLQTDLGVPPTGVVDTATLSAIETKVTQIKAGASSTTPASTTPTT